MKTSSSSVFCLGVRNVIIIEIIQIFILNEIHIELNGIDFKLH